jgi:hypothetical protein
MVPQPSRGGARRRASGLSRPISRPCRHRSRAARNRHLFRPGRRRGRREPLASTRITTLDSFAAAIKDGQLRLKLMDQSLSRSRISRPASRQASRGRERDPGRGNECRGLSQERVRDRRRQPEHGPVRAVSLLRTGSRQGAGRLRFADARRRCHTGGAQDAHRAAQGCRSRRERLGPPDAVDRGLGRHPWPRRLPACPSG